MPNSHVDLNDQEDWLEEVKSHPIFFDSSSSNHLNSPPPNRARSNKFVVINQKDLIVAAGSELRFLSLAKLKASLSTKDGVSINYQILHSSPSSAMPIDPITALIPNPKSRLLAVCSSHQVSVLSLPRPEEQSDLKSIYCYITPVGSTIQSQIYHGEEELNLSSSRLPRVMKVLWHESSHHSSTLLILYASGIAHEYDVSRDTKNPAQIIDFNSLSPIPPDYPGQSHKLSQHDSSFVTHEEKNASNSIKSTTNLTQPGSYSRKTSIHQTKYNKSSPYQSPTTKPHAQQASSRSGTYRPPDSTSTTAVSMCFGTGTGDWGPLTLYCIMRNGDMYAICPYLPKNAVIPLSYRNSLLFFLTAKLESISNSAVDGSSLVDLQKRLYQSLDYLNSWHDVPDLGLDDEFELNNPDENKSTSHKKLVSHLRPLRQGPFLMVPSPIETNENLEETVSDLAHFRYPPASSVNKHLKHLSAEPLSDCNSNSVGVFLIAYQSRIDVCLEVEKIEPRWVHPDSDTNAATSTNNELPTLIAFESIDLGLKEGLDEPCGSETNNFHLHMVFDIRYHDTIYVFHRFGIHAISTLRWIQSLTQSQPMHHDSEVNESLIKSIAEKIGSEVAWVVQTARPTTNPAALNSLYPSITSLCVLDDAYLGYALLAFTSDAQLITLQLQHRPLNLTTSATPDPTLSSSNAPSLQISIQPGIPKSLSHPSYVGYFKERWQVPMLLNEAPSKILGSKLRPPIDPTMSAILRYADKASVEINQYIQRLIEAVNSGQDRLKLQINEYHTQLEQVLQAPEILDGEKGRAISKKQIQRIDNIAVNQTVLIQRADHLLQRLTDDRNRTLCKEESRWFAELIRMKTEVEGEGDRKGLLNEIEQLKNQLNKTRLNVLEEMKKRREMMTEPSASGKLGESQIIPIYHKLAQANSCIVIIRDQITKINSALGKN